MVCGKPSVRLNFTESSEQGATLLLGRIDNPTILNRFLKVLGVMRADTRVFAVFDIREHGTNKIIASAFRAKLTDVSSNEDGLSLTLQAPLPLVFTVVEHADKGATTTSHAPSEEQCVPLPQGEYFAKARIGFHGGRLVGRRSFTIAGKKDGTCWSYRNPLSE
jgi:hypothetical protein